MARTRLVARRNQIIDRPSAITPGIDRALGIVSGVLVLGLGLLAAGLSLAPQLATLGLALLGLGLPIVLLLWRRPEFGLLAHYLPDVQPCSIKRHRLALADRRAGSAGPGSDRHAGTLDPAGADPQEPVSTLVACWRPAACFPGVGPLFDFVRTVLSTCGIELGIQ